VHEDGWMDGRVGVGNGEWGVETPKEPKMRQRIRMRLMRERTNIYFILFYFILFYFILFYFILFYFILLAGKGKATWKEMN